jgi:ornithine carbamoyltransferase
LGELVALSSELKAEKNAGKANHLLAGKTLVMCFAKNSTRTRLSFETAMTQLGGHAIFLSMADSQLSRGESLYDTGAIAGSMADFLMARVSKHTDLEELAEGCQKPTINGLSDLEHPCQALADILTLSENGKLKKGAKLAYIGDCSNNVANSLLMACAMCGLDVTLSGPKKYAPMPGYISAAKEFGVDVDFTENPHDAASNADAIYTDTWISMGMEGEAEMRLGEFEGYCVDSALMGAAKKDAIFMHCLPAHRGWEVAPEVIDGAQSVVFQQAENRLHAQKALLAWLSNQGNGQSQ